MCDIHCCSCMFCQDTANIPPQVHQVTWKFNMWTAVRSHFCQAAQVYVGHPNWVLVEQDKWLFHLFECSVLCYDAVFTEQPFLGFKVTNIPRPLSRNLWPNHQLLPLLQWAPNKTNTQNHLSSSICNFFFITFSLNVYNLPFGSFVFVSVYLAILRPGLDACLTDGL